MARWEGGPSGMGTCPGKGLSCDVLSGILQARILKLGETRCLAWGLPHDSRLPRD